MPTSAFLTDASLCIGCKACEVACKEWNEVPDDGFSWSGHSYDNTRALGASTWRHVLFLEQPHRMGAQLAGINEPFRWQFLSDVCKHCATRGAWKPVRRARLCAPKLARCLSNPISAMAADIASSPVPSERLKSALRTDAR